MTINIPTILSLIAAATTVVSTADDTGCSDDLTVVSKEAIERLREVLLEVGE